MNRCNTSFYAGVDPNEIGQANEVRARSAGGVPGRRHNLMVFLIDISLMDYFLFFICIFSYAHFQE
jgi:hypothetical protein